MIATLKRILKDERGFLGTTAGLIGAGIGAASGAAKSAAAQGAKDKSLQLAAETARYSPWTKMDAGAATQQAMSQPGANFFGDMVQGGFGGGMTGKNISQSDAWNDLLMKKAQLPGSMDEVLKNPNKYQMKAGNAYDLLNQG